jgi:pyruvate dehydrogenase E2 component (dihydrolipoamide acetyltransferase)
MADVVMPRLSDTMEEGTVLRWLKHEGEQVRRGEELVEIETDKATMIYESDLAGVLQILAREGDTLAVGEVIARIGPADDGPPADAGEEPTRSDVAVAERVLEAPAGNRTTIAPTSRGSDGERVKASPLARRVAREGGVDLHTLTGSGPGGRIVKADVQVAIATADASAAPFVPGTAPPASPSAESVATAKGETRTVELSRTQQTIARRMAESKATIPDFTLQAEVDMEECVKLRTELKKLSQPEAPTYNDMVVKACALALHEHPRANGSYRDGRLQLHSRVNIGVAVAVDSGEPTGGALIVPTVFDADLKSLGEIARETRALAEHVREGTITPPELGGGTFTVSNLGMYRVRSFTAIINPPQVAILSVGSLEPRAVVRDEDQLVARSTMAVTLTCDHRILYGADAAELLSRIRELLERPAALTL